MYDKPNRQTYLFPAVDFGAGDSTKYIRGPKGKRGMLRNYGVRNVSETFNQVTTQAFIAVGISGDTDKYGEELGLGAAAAADGEKSVRTTYNVPGDVDNYILDVGHIPADTVLHVTCTAPTGGTPAGIADAFVVIDWED